MIILLLMVLAGAYGIIYYYNQLVISCNVNGFLIETLNKESSFINYLNITTPLPLINQITCKNYISLLGSRPGVAAEIP
jgi:hypothetical protein